MPYSGDTYSLPAGTVGVSGALANVAHVNERFSDLEAAQNAVRPITAGGTGATSIAAVQTAFKIPPFDGSATISGDWTFTGEPTFSAPVIFSDTVDLSGATVTLPDGYRTPIHTIDITSSTGAQGYAIPAGFSSIEIEFHSFVPAVNGGSLALRIGSGGDSGSFLATSTYTRMGLLASGATVASGSASLTAFVFSVATSSTDAANLRARGRLRLFGFNGSAAPSGYGNSGGVSGSSVDQVATYDFRSGTAGDYDAIQILADNGNIVRLEATIWGLA